jgi:hypothetical protein
VPASRGTKRCHRGLLCRVRRVRLAEALCPSFCVAGLVRETAHVWGEDVCDGPSLHAWLVHLVRVFGGVAYPATLGYRHVWTGGRRRRAVRTSNARRWWQQASWTVFGVGVVVGASLVCMRQQRWVFGSLWCLLAGMEEGALAYLDLVQPVTPVVFNRIAFSTSR